MIAVRWPLAADWVPSVAAKLLYGWLEAAGIRDTAIAAAANCTAVLSLIGNPPELPRSHGRPGLAARLLIRGRWFGTTPWQVGESVRFCRWPPVGQFPSPAVGRTVVQSRSRSVQSFGRTVFVSARTCRLSTIPPAATAIITA
ncbi:hypothetical protein GCM10009872_50890 [Actinopolymorpha rutila]